MDLFRRSMRVLGIVLVCYTLLVATHKGEFWPFSIYPMFSQAGRPWTRALVRAVPPSTSNAEAAQAMWETASLEDLPGEAFPLLPHGTFQNDLSNYVSKTEVWDARRIRGLRGFFNKPMEEKPAHRLLVMRVRGRLAGDSVAVVATPLALLSADTTRFNPHLDVPVRP